MPQLLQFPQQEDLPAFLSFINLKITAATMAMSTAETMIFPRLPVIHVIICYLPFIRSCPPSIISPYRHVKWFTSQLRDIIPA